MLFFNIGFMAKKYHAINPYGTYQQSLKCGTIPSDTINPSVTLCFQTFQHPHLMVKMNWPIFSSIHYLTSRIKTDTRLLSGKHSKIIPSQSLTQVAYLYNLS